MKDPQSSVQIFLKNKLLELQAKNKRFSLRSFANKLQMNSGAVSEILSGHRKVSRKMTEKICLQLKLNPSERIELLKNFPDPLKKKDNKTLEREVHTLTSEQFQLLSNWIHFGLLSLMNSGSFRSDNNQLAKRFDCKTSEVKKALANLEKVGLIRKNNLNNWERTHKRINTSDGLPNAFIRKSHIADLKLIKEKMTEVTVENRDYTSFTFPANPDLIIQAKDILRKAQEDLADLMKESNPQEVYRVNMYLYPLTTPQQERL